MAERIINWIRQQVKQAGAKGIVLGISGGLDSAVTAALAKKAVGREKLLALILPIHSQIQDLKDARLIAKKLGIKAKTINLSRIYDNLIGILPHAARIAQANLKPRLRMLVLYYFANKLNYLVCGTGNKSELMAGYFTKYGDGGVDILPIGGLFKAQLKELAKELGIPQCFINKPPAAGLWPGQTDEAEMGITYPELDDILGRMLGEKKQVLSKEKVNKVKRMHERSRHKRQGPEICYLG